MGMKCMCMSGYVTTKTKAEDIRVENAEAETKIYECGM